MRRTLPFFAAALLPLCGAAALCALALAAPAGAQSGSNVNGNLNRAAGPTPSGETQNTNSNSDSRERVAEADESRRLRFPPLPTVRWADIDAIPGTVGTSPLALRAKPDARAPVAEEVDVEEYPPVEVLETAGDFLRVRWETGNSGEGRKPREVEGWAEWGAALPHTTALVIDARDGRVLRRVALGPGINAVAFSPDGERALFHGRWAQNLYEAAASDLVPLRRLEGDSRGSFGPAAYTGTGHDLLITFWGMIEGAEVYNSSVHLARVDGGGVTVTPSWRSPAAVEPASLAFAPDGRTGFAFYPHPYANAYGGEEESPSEEDRGPVATVEVFDPATLMVVRRFKLPDAALGFDADSLALNADGSELYLLDQTGQRLVAVETQTGGLLYEVSLAGETTRLLSFAPGTTSGAGPLVRFWEASEEHHGTPLTLRLEGGRAVTEEGFAFTAEAGGTRYAVDDSGTRLFTLGADDGPRAKRETKLPDTGGHTPVGLFATPDGSRLILILSFPEHGC